MIYALRFNEILTGLHGIVVAFLDNIAKTSLKQSCKHEQRQYALRGCGVNVGFVRVSNNDI
jgi:hypothetical protein